MTCRRTFLQTAAAASLLAASSASAQSKSPSEKITVALVGCGGRGGSLAGEFKGLPNVELAWLCEPDESRQASAAKTYGVKADHVVSDMRKLYDRKDLDAVIVATPDHWHAPAAILACEAGKHVYVEKPCSHNVREGRL